MKKMFMVGLLLAFIFSGFGALPVNASGIKVAPSGQLDNVFTFEQLGYSEKMLVGPFDSSSVFFSLPANMQLAVGSSVTLTYALAWSGSSGDATDLGVAGTLLVYFNDQLIDTLILDGAGEVSKEIAIPESALIPSGADQRHQLRVFLNADINCRFENVHTTLLLSKRSSFDLQYDTVSPSIDLSLLPQPIFQPDSILPSTAVIVIPDNPEAFELQAALTVSAGLGSITGGELGVNLVTNSNLTSDVVSSNHLIFVGLASHFPNLSVANLPLSVSGSGLNLPQDHDQDGVIQIGQSPWSQSSVVLYIGGNSPEAVAKASQSFSTGNVVAVEKPDLSLVASTSPVSQDGGVFIDRTLKDLGYESQTLGLFGEDYISYFFYASPEQASSTGGYFDLILSHSDLLDYDSTGMTVILNDEVIGGVRFTEESPTTTRIKLVPGVLRRGVNRLEIFSDIVPFYTCYSTDLLSTWITVNETSIIHLPVSEQTLDIGLSANLRDFPYMFLSSTSLSDVAFILAADDSVSWAAAANTAFYIGASGNLPIVNLKVAYADDVSDDILKDNNLLVFGRSSTLPVLSQFNELLPAPFQPGSDIAVQPSMMVNYSLLPDTSVGYLQLLPSPWNSERVILTVLGNTQTGIPMAGTSLTRDDLVAKLAGNFAILYEDQVLSTDTRLGISKEGLVSELPVAVTVTPSQLDSLPPSGQGQVVEERPDWILPVIGATTLLIVGFLVFVFYKGLVNIAGSKGKQTSKTKSTDNERPAK